MDSEKQTYYISIGKGEIFSTPNVSPWQFKISATDQEIKQLRSIFNDNDENSVGDYIRSHIPIMQYHNDPTNDRYDQNLVQIYRLLYELGDQEAKEHIESMGILDDFTSI